MKKSLLVFFIFILTNYLNIYAQKISLESGDLNFLKGIKSVTLEFDYHNMSVGEFENGEDYVSKKRSEYNLKESGKGDKWADEWISDRTSRFQVRFKKAIDFYCPLIDFNENNDSEYTLIVRTISTEPGFNAYIHRKPAEVDLEFKFISDTGKELAVLILRKVEGRDVPGYASGPRIEGAYERAGTALGKYIHKKIK